MEPQVWYASYGSNMSRSRFLHYLQGGRPDGSTRDYSGSRNRTGPLEVEPVELKGSLCFAWESPTWGGGVAFYEPDAPGVTLGRAYLLTAGQLADVAAQEMHRRPDVDLDLAPLWSDRQFVLGPGRYERLLVVGEIRGVRVVTFTSSWSRDEVQLNAPAAAYLRTMAIGLREAHELTVDAIIDYLLACRGTGPGWTRSTLAAALS
ncbi:MAG: histone deacetylase [Propionibacteriales bacterium]|nr:histone deacetylase [Propionibacteriales bacterium]